MTQAPVSLSYIFSFKKVFGISPKVQIIILVILYLLSIISAYLEFQMLHTAQMLDPNKDGFHLYIFAPLYEEVLFRGVILWTLLRFINPIQAIGFSSFLFAIWHLKNIFLFPDVNLLWYQVVYAGIFIGPILGYISYRTQTIWIGVMLHMLNNTLAPWSWFLLSFLHF